MTFTDLKKALNSGDFKPVYLLHGDESFFIDKIVDLFENKVIDESLRSFNQLVLYGKEVDHLTVIDTARRYPMMSDKQLVILKEAQEMRSLKDLHVYMDNPMPSTVFVIAHKHNQAWSIFGLVGHLVTRRADKIGWWQQCWELHRMVLWVQK